MRFDFNNRFEQLGDDFFARVKPAAFEDPFLVAVSDSAAKLVGTTPDAAHFGGQKMFEGGAYIASVYSGHQFGSYVTQLGDGRAIMIGEVNGWEMQLKGSGKTPFSRFGDGRAVLRSCIREFLCSEVMHHLGIPTTRALCIVGSNEDVVREGIEKAAMLTRLSPSHIRFGHFEYFYYTQQKENLQKLLDFTVANYFSGAAYDEFFESVVLKTASLIAKWQAAGFCHGVMNTDNMSVLGLTIDYGPFGFLDRYDAQHICNHSDHTGRYAYDQQPGIAMWNLYALAQTLTGFIAPEKLEAALLKFQPALTEEYAGLMRGKLGLEGTEPEDLYLIKDLLELMQQDGVDYNIFFRQFSHEPGQGHMFAKGKDGFEAWLKKYKARGRGESKGMLKVNPKYILRNYLAETAIRSAEMGQYSEVAKLLKILEKPFDEQAENEPYADLPPDWAQGVCVSCSS